MSHKVWISVVLVILTSFIMSNMDNQEDVLKKVLSSYEYSRIFYNEKRGNRRRERMKRGRKHVKCCRNPKREQILKNVDVIMQQCQTKSIPNC